MLRPNKKAKESPTAAKVTSLFSSVDIGAGKPEDYP